MLTRISRVLMEFDDDSRLPVYGLSGQIDDGEPSDMFSFTPENPTAGCRSFGEIIQRYRSITPKVQLADVPLNFAPVIREAIACAEKDPGGFYMVIIISTGHVNEAVEQEMAQAIVDASNYPISEWGTRLRTRSLLTIVSFSIYSDHHDWRWRWPLGTSDAYRVAM